MDIKSYINKAKTMLGGLSSAKRRSAIITVVASAIVMVMLMSFVLIKRYEVCVYVDGEETARFTTLESDSEKWLELSGVEVLDGDGVTFDGTDIYVSRAFYVTVSADGVQTTLQTLGTTVRDVLELAEIEVSEDDMISMELDAELTESAQIVINRVSTSTVTETETLKYETEKVETDQLYVGESKVKTEGENGKREYVYSLRYVDGEEVERTLVSDEIVKEAVNKVVLVGTKEKPKPVTTSSTPTSYKAVYTMNATAYTYGNDGGNRTSTGIRPYKGIVAVDPKVIPLGSKLYIESADGKYVYGTAVAADTGGAIKGNKIDVFLESDRECSAFGRRTVNVYVLD